MQIIIKKMVKYRKWLILFSLVLFFVFSKNAQAACVLNNASWSGPIKTGQAVYVLVSGTGCNGFSASINIFEDNFGSIPDVHIKGITITFDNDTQAQGQVTITESEFDKIFSGSQTNKVYFKANAAESEIRSNTITITLSGTGPSPGLTYACVAADGKYACSPDGTLAGCQNLAACKTEAKSVCVQRDKSLCGKSSSAVPLSFTLNIPNPLSATDFGDFLKKLSNALFALAIPAAVFIIIWAGVRLVLSRGNQIEIAAARKMLWYAILGLAIILIGGGFISLIRSILNLGGSSSPTQQSK